MISDTQIITKTKILNKKGLNFFITFNNILKVRGISIETNNHSTLIENKLNKKNDFQYLFLKEINEFIILPNSKLDELIMSLNYEIETCADENELIDLIISKM
jgi:hypothetical protein